MKITLPASNFPYQPMELPETIPGFQGGKTSAAGAKGIAKLPEVTGDKNAKETRDYVRRIFGLYFGYVVG